MEEQVITVGDVMRLARLGARFVRQEWDKGVIYWIGYLPTKEDLDKAEEALGKFIPPDCVPVSGRVICSS